MARVKYLGKSKRSFAVRPRGVEYKWKPGMTHIAMDEDHARVLVAERPDLWEVDPNPLDVATAEGFPALITADIPATGVTVAEVEENIKAFREEVKRRRKSESSDESG